MSHPRANPGDEVHSISTVQESLAADQAGRRRVYFIQMSIRVVCFLGAVAASGWLRWALVAAALVLPYSAVIFANAGKDRREYDVAVVQHLALPATPTEPPPDPGERLAGEPQVIEHRPDADEEER